MAIPEGEPEIQRQRRAAIRVARSILQRDIGIVEGARQMLTFRSSIGIDEFDEDILTFVVVDSETDHLLAGEARRHYQPSFLARQDVEIADVEAFYRGEVFNACRSVIQRFRVALAPIRIDPATVPPESDLRLLSADLAARSLSPVEIILPHAEVLTAIEDLTERRYHLWGWEGWLLVPDGSIRASVQHQGVRGLEALSLEEAARICAETIMQAEAEFVFEPERPGARLYFALSGEPG
jgi:hypothetical protein